jgi:hypothetical protein
MEIARQNLSVVEAPNAFEQTIISNRGEQFF